MAVFDFISGDDFRVSLESDYRELESAIETQAWKAAHVLAGSIVEAILIDYLVAVNYRGKGETAILKMSLEDAIEACEKEQYLSSRAASLSTVVRSYRNLIHPGRVVRLGESIDENSANVARALVNMIIGEVASRKQQSFGYTAEQITAKIEQDPSVSSILPHLLRESRPSEIERLLLKVLPARHFTLSLQPEINSRVLQNMQRCFRLAFDQSADALKSKVAKRFVSVLKEESGEFVASYEAGFFSGGDLAYLMPGEQSMVKQHVLARLSEDETLSFDTLFRLIRGLGASLNLSEVDTLINAVVREYTNFANDAIKSQIRSALDAEYSTMSSEAQQQVLSRLKYFSRRFAQANQPAYAEDVEQMTVYLELPF